MPVVAAAVAADPAAAGAVDVTEGVLKLLAYVPPSNRPSCIFSVAEPNFWNSPVKERQIIESHCVHILKKKIPKNSHQGE